MIRERIYQKMLNRGVSQVSLCNDLCLTVANFNAYIRGKRTMPAKSVFLILEYLHMTIGPKGQPFSMYPPDKLNVILKERLEQGNISVKQLSLVTGICEATIFAMLKGNRPMSTKHLDKMLSALSLDVIPYKKSHNP